MTVGAWWVWPTALAIYALFRPWYDNWRGPLSPHEIEHFMALAAKAPGTAHTDLLVLRRFLESDDGKEFVMANVVRLHAGQVPHPESGKLYSAGTRGRAEAFRWCVDFQAECVTIASTGAMRCKCGSRERRSAPVSRSRIHSLTVHYSELPGTDLTVSKTASAP